MKGSFTQFLDKFNVLGTSLSLVTGAVITIGGIWFFAKSKIEEVVSQEVKKQLAPSDLYNEALQNFNIGRELESFEKFDKCLKLYKLTHKSPSDYQSLLDTYLWCVANAKSPEIHKTRIATIQNEYKTNNLTPSLNSELFVAYFTFNLGDLEGATNAYERLRKFAAVQENNNAEGAVYLGLTLCAIARGDTEEALAMYRIANSKDPYSYSEWLPNENDPNQQRWAKQYPDFQENAKNFQKRWRLAKVNR